MGRRLPLLLATLLLVAGCAGRAPASQSPVANVSTSDDDGLHGIVLPSAYHVPSRSLVDTAGRPYDLARAATRHLPPRWSVWTRATAAGSGWSS